MIRRRQENSLWLITQYDHAKLAGELAKSFGNAQFAGPDPYESTLLAIAQHDAGWQAVDARPPLSKAGLPLDVFEAPRTITHVAWLESAKSAAKIDPYVGLLVSLHQLALSASSISNNQPSRFDVQQLRQQFDLNKFQHAMIELAEGLRAKLGLSLDKPLRLGLPEGWSDDAERPLLFNFRLLQAMDLLSLAVCCTEPPAIKTGDVLTRPGGTALQLQIHRPARDTLLVKPWPFAGDAVEVNLPYREVSNRVYSSVPDLQAELAPAEMRSLKVTVRPA